MDSDGLDEALADRGIEMIAPRKRGRKRTQDAKKQKRYKHRWKIERLFAWPGNYRRQMVRYKRHAENFLCLVRLACVLILLRSRLRERA